MQSTIWAQASDIELDVLHRIMPGFDYGFDAAVPEHTRAYLMEFMGWVEENFALPITLWVDFEYRHYLVSRQGKRVGYLFYWNDVDTWPVFADKDEIPMIRLPVRNEQWTLEEILESFVEAITDYYAWLCRTSLTEEGKKQTVERILNAYRESRHE